MILEVRDQLLLGAYITCATDRLTRLALNRLGTIPEHVTLRMISATLINIGVYYATGSALCTIPGLAFAATLQIRDCIVNKNPEASSFENAVWGTGEDLPTFTELYEAELRKQRTQ